MSPATGSGSSSPRKSDALVVEPARAVESDEHLIRREHHLGVDLIAPDDLAFAIGAVGDLAAVAHDLATGG